MLASNVAMITDVTQAQRGVLTPTHPHLRTKTIGLLVGHLPEDEAKAEACIESECHHGVVGIRTAAVGKKHETRTSHEGGVLKP